MQHTMAVTCFVGLACATACNADDTLAQIERHLVEQYTSLRSAEVQFRVIAMAPAQGPIPQASLDRAVRWEWLVDGTKKLIHCVPQKLADGQFYLEWYSFDGSKAYDAACYQADGSRLETIRIRPTIERRYSFRAAPSWMLGLHVEGCDSNTADWLARRTPETVQDLGTEHVRGHECRKVRFDNVPVDGKFLTRAIVWFDPAVDWLPRKLEWGPRRLAERSADAGPIRVTLERGETMGRVDVVEYMQVDDAVLGRNRWFPKRADYLMGASATVFQIDEVSINGAIDGGRFVPVPVAGTQVEDQSSGQQSTLLHGGDEGVTLRQKMLKSAELIHLRNTGAIQSDVDPAAVTSGETPDARPSRGKWWILTTLTCGVAIILLWFRWRARRVISL